MSNRKGSIDGWLSVLMVVLIYHEIYKITKPSNPKRPHWFNFYFVAALIFGILIGQLVYLAGYAMDSPQVIIGTAIYCSGVFTVLFFFVKRDLPLVENDRAAELQQASELDDTYIDPYRPRWLRRIFVIATLWGFNFLFHDFTFKPGYTAATVVILVILYTIRDVIYANKIKPDHGSVSGETITRKELFQYTLNKCVQDLEERGVPYEYIGPPINQLMWALGIRCKPLIYSGPLNATFSLGIFWFVAFGGAVSVLDNPRIGDELFIGLLLLSSIAFGGIMAFFIQRQNKINVVPEWNVYEKMALAEVGKKSHA